MKLFEFCGGQMEKSAISRKIRTLVPVPKLGIDTHGQRQSGTGTNQVVSIPIHGKGLVLVPIKVEQVPMLPIALIFAPLHC